jgi:hypothetical protein
MGTALLDTNLNQSPYWDDFASNSSYYVTLFKPAIAVQARELIALQSTLQNQISNFGENVLTEGTIVKGCSISFNKNLAYVKILDNYANGTALTITDLNKQYAVSNSGLKAFIYSSQQGFVSQSPNLNTFFVKYLNSATNTAIKTFQNDEVLTIVTSANLVVGQVTVANAISSGASNTTGFGYSMSVDEGIIFQKGFFLNVAKQTTIVTPYTNFPDGLSVGFTSSESIVTAYQDQSLFDNAQGSSNFAAPGADRLQIIPNLTVIASNAASNNFFSLVTFVAGGPSIINQQTSYAVLGQKMASISNDTNGSFVVSPFAVRLLELANTSGGIDPLNLKLEIDGGEAYVQGYNVDIVGKVLSVVPKAYTSNSTASQILSAQLGNFVTVNEFAGYFGTTSFEKVSLRSAVALGVSNNLAKGIGPNAISPPGAEIGTADILAVQYNTGEVSTNAAQYNIYLFNVQMTSNNPFASVKSLYANAAGVIGVADIVPINGAAQLQNPNFTPYVYQFNQVAVKTLETGANTIDTQFTYYTSTNVSFSNTGVISITVPSFTGGVNELPFGSGQLTTGQMGDFLVVSQNTITTANLSGTATVAAGNTTVTGLSTSFSSALYDGALLTLANSTVSETKQILSIANNTSLTVGIPFTTAFTAVEASITIPAGQPLPLGVMGANVNIVNSSSFTINLNKNFSTPFTAIVDYNIQRVTASPIKKQLQTQVYVTINCASNPGGTKGPWCLGVPDVFSVANVWVGSTFSAANPSVAANFSLNNGQQDTFYGLSYLQSKGASLTANSMLLVELKAFVPDYSHGAGFFSVDSYPVDDTGLTANSIFTQDIPYYQSALQTYNLRNSMDFRFYVQNTIPYVSNVTLAVSNTQILNPANTVVFANTDLMLPVPDSEIESSLQFYLGRYDKIGLTTSGAPVVNRGTPAENPIPPSDIINGMTLATAYIPPYPSITVDVDDPNMSNAYPTASLVYNTNRVYTMADIGQLDARLTQVEYYTSLSVLEQSAQNLLLTNGAGANRFQNGILADPMADFSIANTTDPEFNIAIDSVLTEARPTFTQQVVKMAYVNSLSNNVTLSNNGRLITLNYSQVATPLVTQGFASQTRNCIQDSLYTWRGVVTLTPEGNYQPDTTTNPDVVVATNSYANWVNLANAWNTQWGTWSENKGFTGLGTTLVTNTVNQNIVTNVELQPFCQAQLIRFSAYGLLPNTQFWTYFNDTPISNNCVQTDSNFNILNTNTMISDANGNISGLFYLPADTFYTGTILFQIVDVQSLVTETNSITSLASTNYYGTNLAYTQNDLSLQTTTAQLTTTSVAPVITPAPTVPTTTSGTTVKTTTTIPLTNYGSTSGSDGSGSGGTGSGSATGSSSATGAGGGAAGGGSGGGGGGGGKVLCTYFFEKGYINKEEYFAEVRYALSVLSKEEINGYRFWAIPYVKMMRKSQTAEAFMKILFRNWMDEILFRAGKKEKGSWLGKALYAVGVPISGFIGKRVKEQDWKQLWGNK